MGKLLVDEGVLTEWDLVPLCLYCQAYADYLKVQKYAAFPIVKTPQGYPICNPAVAVQNKMWEMVLKAACEFGMTPSSRTRVSVNKKAQEKKLPAARFFEKTG